MLGESWALFMSHPHNEVDCITPYRCLTHTRNFACSLSLYSFLPSLPNYLSPHRLSALSCKRKERPQDQKGAQSFA